MDTVLNGLFGRLEDVLIVLLKSITSKKITGKHNGKRDALIGILVEKMDRFRIL